MDISDITHLQGISVQTKTLQSSAVTGSLRLQEESLRRIGDPSPNLLVGHSLEMFTQMVTLSTRG